MSSNPVRQELGELTKSGKALGVRSFYNASNVKERDIYKIKLTWSTSPSWRNNAVSAQARVSGSFSGSRWAAALLCLAEGCLASVNVQENCVTIHRKVQEKQKNCPGKMSGGPTTAWAGVVLLSSLAAEWRHSERFLKCPWDTDLWKKLR
jgi:hypothetical protein